MQSPPFVLFSDSESLSISKLLEHLVDFRCFLASQSFNRAEVEIMSERIRFFQNMLQRIKSDSVFYQ
jgi:hypothetical protein